MANKSRRRSALGFGVNLTGGGTIFTLGFIALAVGMGLLLTRGVTPRSVLSDPGQTGDIELVVEPPDPEQKGLQLKTLKFKECASTVTIDFMLDKSTSMDQPTPSGVSKFQRLKEAVKSIVGKSHDDSIIGIQSFTTNDITNDVPVSYYRDIKNTLIPSIDSLRTRSSTPTYEALAFSYQVLSQALLSSWYPKDRQMNFIFISDGAPCPGIGCPGNAGANQDPRLYTPNPADQIKELGVTVYTLGIYSQSDRNQVFVLEDLLKSIATSPDHYFAADTGDDVQRLLNQISNRICNSAATPTQTP